MVTGVKYSQTLYYMRGIVFTVVYSNAFGVENLIISSQKATNVHNTN